MKAEDLKNLMRLFLQSIRDYEHESGKAIYHDDRDEMEFVELFIDSEDGFLFKELTTPQHPTPTLTDKVIEDIVENSVTKNYVDGKFYAMRVARVALKKARDFMQSGEAPQEYRFLTYEDDNLLERLDSCLAQIEMPSDVNNEYEAVRELISNRLSKTPQESKGDGIDLEKELDNYAEYVYERFMLSKSKGYDSLSPEGIKDYLSTRQGEGERERCNCGTEEHCLPDKQGGKWVCGKCDKPY